MKLNLSEKQKKFCELYLKTLNATQSYKQAYKPNSKESVINSLASRLLTNEKVATYIRGRLQQMENKRIADANEVMEYLTSVVRGEVSEQKPVFDKENGTQLVETKAMVSDRNKAAELLGKRYALFTEKKEITGKVGVQIVDDID